jgi:carboxyl-terminal processing protease
VKLTIRRGNLAPFDVTLTRAIIHIASVKGLVMRDSIAYLRIASFSANTTDELIKAYKEAKKKAGKITGVVLDLRNNPGGLLDQAVGVSNAFLDHGEIVSTRGRNPNEVQRWDAHSGGDITDGLPIVILINGGTASAAEIVSGALQDNHRALILGTRSFGKGSVQTIMPLSGDNGAIRLTTARYYTPSGRSIQEEGIHPDITVEQAKIETIAETGMLHESDLKGALKNTGPDTGEAPPTTADTADEDGSTAKDLVDAEAKDYQLTRALDLVKGAAFFGGQNGN